MDFPNVDPIPIPAPVWLMKALSLLTLSLHFVAVQLLIGSLVAVIWFSYRGQATQSNANKSAANVLARRLTIVMTYVINLGIPPLLFAQVLYGRALYTSSVLIAVIWICILPLLAICYYLLYWIAHQTKAGKPVALLAVIALLFAAGVGRILSMNMTLMLNPGAWKSMYAHTATGLHLYQDPTAWWRWGYMMLAGVMTSGLWVLLHSSICTIEDDTKAVMRRTGGVMTAIGGISAAAVAYMVFTTQPSFVLGALARPVTGPIAHYESFAVVGGGAVCVIGAMLAVLLALTQYARTATNVPLTLVGALGAFLSICGAVVARDGIRDLTLRHWHFSVWYRIEVANWWVLGLFFLVFVASLGVIGWLLMVMRQAKPISEQVAS